MNAFLRKLFLPLAGALTAAPAAVAQAPAQGHATPQAAVERLHEAERAHLKRVLGWGAANAVAGTALLLASDGREQPGLRGFALQTTAWGVINAGIGAAGLLFGSPREAETWVEALRAEGRFAEILLLNLGLNLGYAGVGAAVWIAGTQGVDQAAAWRGHGSAVVVQGLGLFVLDGVAYLAGLDRRAQVRRAIEAGPSPNGVAVRIRLP